MAKRILKAIELPARPILRYIKIFHPGYEDDQPLLRFLGVDTEDGGLWLDVALTACSIISNNADGWLENKQGKVETEIVPAGDYWWHTADKKYAVLTDFRLWRFPSTLPTIWSSQTAQNGVERCCQLTSQEFGYEQSHIIPRGETEWFEMNSMGVEYLDDRANDVDCDANKMILRSDLHKGLDDKLFAFFPKGDEVVLHCFDKVAYGYHNLPLQRVPSKELLLARFAYNILPIFVVPWLKMKRARWLWVEDNGKLVTKEVAAEECQDIAHRPRVSKSTSPKKRKTEEKPALDPRILKRKSCDSFDSALDIEDPDHLREMEKYWDWLERDRGRKRTRV